MLSLYSLKRTTMALTTVPIEFPAPARTDGRSDGLTEWTLKKHYSNCLSVYTYQKGLLVGCSILNCGREGRGEGKGKNRYRLLETGIVVVVVIGLRALVVWVLNLLAAESVRLWSPLPACHSWDREGLKIGQQLANTMLSKDSDANQVWYR